MYTHNTSITTTLRTISENKDAFYQFNDEKFTPNISENAALDCNPILLMYK